MPVRQKTRKKIKKNSNMSFWKDKPVKTSTNIQVVLEKDVLLKKICNEINDCKFKLTTEYVDVTDVSTQIKLLEFINANYDYEQDEFKLEYSLSLLKYFFQDDCIPLAFYSLGRMVGFILGAKKQMVVNKNEFTSIEVNFLCILGQLRDLHLSSYMINVLTKHALERDIITAIYTVGKDIKAPAFCKKRYYHLPINYKLLKEIGMIDMNCKEIVSDSKSKHEIVYYHCDDVKVSKEFINNMQVTMQNFHNASHLLYDKKSFVQIKEWFENPAFHVFFIDNDFFCLYRLDTKDKKSGRLCKNGYVYTYNTLNYHLIERIREYCKEHNIFDLITVVDPFGIDKDDYQKIGFLPGTGRLNYYYYNLKVPRMSTRECGFVTI
jgi:hypothetical protein